MNVAQSSNNRSGDDLLGRTLDVRTQSGDDLLGKIFDVRTNIEEIVSFFKYAISSINFAGIVSAFS